MPLVYPNKASDVVLVLFVRTKFTLHHIPRSDREHDGLYFFCHHLFCDDDHPGPGQHGTHDQITKKLFYFLSQRVENKRPKQKQNNL